MVVTSNVDLMQPAYISELQTNSFTKTGTRQLCYLNCRWR